MTMMLIDSENFRRRCASALTHPVTVAARCRSAAERRPFQIVVAGLLGHRQAQRPGVGGVRLAVAGVCPVAVSEPAAFRPAGDDHRSYVGLPALYAAFNTFEPVHDRILWGLSLVAGGTAGSPLDPTDSLVIPFGLGIACGYGAGGRSVLTG